ncbi:TMEM165/GDT1 family protein [Kineococcus sp. LSe6-4]|uniref:GDT1 family protein n=1 Tax=Kineococcus halophytocola TaxID=3234027 RepID=A0ABV4GVJ0_9ACTN
MDLAVLAASFLPVLLLELPDKTFVATLVLSTRFRPLTAWVGVGLAFAVQSLIAVVAGRLLAQLPERPVAAAAAVLFAVGAVVLFRGAAKAAEAGAQARSEYEASIGGGRSGWRGVLTCFGVVFLAEWGDLSQLFTAGLAARYDDPVSVFVGAWAALLVVAGLAAVAGRAVVRRLSVAAVSRFGGVVCTVLAVLSALEAAGVQLPV